MKNKAMSFSIFGLALLVLILVSVSITGFILRDKKIKDDISLSNSIDGMQVYELQLNYQISKILLDAVKNSDKEILKNDKKYLKEKFIEELFKYRNGEDYVFKELNQVYLQADKIEIRDSKVYLKVLISIEKKERGIVYSRSYEKEFFAVI